MGGGNLRSCMKVMYSLKMAMCLILLRKCMLRDAVISCIFSCKTKEHFACTQI